MIKTYCLLISARISNIMMDERMVYGTHSLHYVAHMGRMVNPSEY